jgi:prephenate dehydrogenase
LDPPFRSIAIAGLGLIGGSIALAVRERWPSTRVVGIDTAAVAAHALGGGAIDRAVESVGGLTDCELLILAAPVRQNIALLRALDTSAPTDASRAPEGPVRRSGASAQPMLVTDVGGTKRSIVEAARQLPHGVTFVGGHPLGGGERGGFAFARPDLFAGRPWILTPSSSASGEDVARLSAFAAGLGARPSNMTPDEHDRLMAYVSHLPQLAASAVMQAVGGAAGEDGLRMAGKGLLDTTRLASSPADVWRDLCATNADNIGAALDVLIARLTELRADLERGDALRSTFDEAAHWRSELMKGLS